MASFDWQGLMDRWNQDLLSCPSIVATLSPAIVASGWLGYAPATGEEIWRAERRLKVSLPPSYRQFLETTNGWRTLGRWVGRLWSADEVDWYRVREQDTIDAWIEGERSQGGPDVVPDEEYYVYGPAQLPETMRSAYLSTALQVSEVGNDNGVYLLNPEVVTPDGEWEAWFFAPWLPGADRYRSFWDLMNAEHGLFKC